MPGQMPVMATMSRRCTPVLLGCVAGFDGTGVSTTLTGQTAVNFCDLKDSNNNNYNDQVRSVKIFKV